jgi:uncharacterized membrane protein
MLAAMGWLGKHLRNKLLAGALAAAPLVVLVWGAIWLEEKTRPLAESLGWHFPGLGIVLVIVGVYLLGIIVTSLFGKFLLTLLDRVVRRIPGFGYLYQAWKDVSAAPARGQGIYDQVVLLPNFEGAGAQIGFSSGESVPGDEHTLCVFLPGSPQPVTGRLVLVRRRDCLPLKVSVAEAFKFLLSTGNYVPPGLVGPDALPVNLAAETRSP